MITNKNPKHHHHHYHHNHRPKFSLYSPKLSIFLLATCTSLFILFQIYSLRIPLLTSPYSQPLLPSSWDFIHQFRNLNSISNDNATCSSAQQADKAATGDKLRQAVTFLPFKDLRYAHIALQGHTWFMSSMYDKQEEGEVQYQEFPSEASNGRLLCFKGNDHHDGAWNYYALAWPETLPYNATLMKGLTFVSYNHYDYGNMWHGLSAVFPFVAWHVKNKCSVGPSRWVLLHWGEYRTGMGSWVTSLMEATFGGPFNVEKFDHGSHGGGDDGVVCFEHAVVMRHNEGGMSRQRRMEAYDFMRCRAREYCNASTSAATAEVGGGGGRRGLAAGIGMTLLTRTGARSFRNETAVVGIFEKECRKVEGCRLMVANSNNLTFCQQVKLMSMTDIFVSPHGAQFTNMFLMDRNSSAMEFFPKGWLKLAGVGQFVFQWMASWSGMNHRGTWRDPNGDPCPYPDNDRRCMSVYKNGKIGYNETYFSEWARNVLNDMKQRKLEEGQEKNKSGSQSSSGCACG